MRHQRPQCPQAARGDPPRRRPHGLLAASTATAIAAMATLVPAGPSAAQTSPDKELRDSVQPVTTAEDCPGDTDAPACPEANRDDEDENEGSTSVEFVEQLPPPSLLEQVPTIRPDWVPNPNLLMHGSPGTNLHSCGSFYIDRVSYTHNYLSTSYTRFHVVVTWQYKFFLAGDAVADLLAWNALENCIHVYGPPHRVRSWLSIKQQFLCHAQVPFSIGTGPTWDLEGTRPANNNLITWVKKRCNW